MTERNGAEAQRVAALDSYGIMDSPPELVFDRLVALAARFFQAPTALISLQHADRQWFKARVGFEGPEPPRSTSFCSHAIGSTSVMIVPNATRDKRFADNPLVTGPASIRFYAGAPLITPEGFALGTLCVIDTVPRMGVTRDEQEVLSDLAALAMDALEMRRRLRSLSAD